MPSETKMTTGQVLFEQLADEPAVRVKSILHLGAMLADGIEGAPEVLKDALFEGGYSGDLSSALGVSEEVEDEDTFFEWFVEQRHNSEKARFGFAVEVSRSLRQVGQSHFTWSFTTSRWFYDETFDAAVQAGVCWATEQ